MSRSHYIFFTRPIALFILAMTLILSGGISANKGLEIAKLSDKNNDGYGDSSSSMTMQLINRKGDVVERKLAFKRLEVPEDGDKSIAVFESPRDVKGVAILSYAQKVESDDQWLYLPALKRVKRIASKNKSGPFLGSEFSFEDFSFQYYFYIEVEDNPGVMASITTALAESNIGIESMVQKEDLGNNLVPIILISDIFKENKLEGIKDKILSLSSVTNLRTIRIESTD